MPFRILCSGDVHLGRRPTRIPEGIDAGSLGPRTAWQAIVASAIERKVDAVVLTGDVADASNRFYEAFSVLQSGIEQLVEAKIPIVAVSGNHDFDVLARLADQFAEFRLLGRGGRWEEVILQQQEEPAVRFQGWSFPAGHVLTNPLDDYPSVADDIPTVGVLHCDCDASASRYAPVTTSQLKATSPAAWLLGHIHKPSLLSESLPLILYPGSPVGLDPGEPGAHGAWIVTIDKGRKPTAELLPLAPLRWEQIDVPLEEVSDDDSLGPAILDAIRASHDEIRDELTSTRAVGCRLSLRGRTAIHRNMPAITSDTKADCRLRLDDVEYFIEKLEDLSRPDVPLEDIAKSTDPAGLLARQLILLETRQPTEDYQRLVRDAGLAMQERRSQPVFASLPDSTAGQTGEQVRSTLIRAGTAVLDILLAQREVQA